MSALKVTMNGELLERYMKERGVGVEDVASKAELDRRTIYAALNSKKMRVDTAEKIAAAMEAYGVDVDRSDLKGLGRTKDVKRYFVLFHCERGTAEEIKAKMEEVAGKIIWMKEEPGSVKLYASMTLGQIFAVYSWLNESGNEYGAEIVILPSLDGTGVKLVVDSRHGLRRNRNAAPPALGC